jgi:glycosyltransferase involved in cell wall biosynthesis
VAKGREVVLGALAELERRGLGPADFTLTVFGRASAETIERLARFDTARYAGSYRSGDLERLLERFHVGLMPSVWEEAYGYVGVEFLACGLPVIASARGGMVDYTRDGETGWTNLDCSPQGLADIVAGIVAEPRQVLDLNARIRDRRDEIVKPFERHAEEMLELYAELAGRPTPLPARSARAGGAATPA